MSCAVGARSTTGSLATSVFLEVVHVPDHGIDVRADARGRFGAMGAALWEARAAEELERVAPGRSRGELTPTEAHIAALVAEGLKNREIGASLFIGVATVEANLTRIYRKLGIRSRSQLTRLVADGAVAQAGDGSA